MHSTKRLTAALALTLALAGTALAQETATATTTTATTTSSTAGETTASITATKTDEETQLADSNVLRNEFLQVMRQYPPEVGTILALDPSLLTNEGFMSSYPDLAKFVAAHPEVRRSPKYYLEDFEPAPPYRPSTLDDILQGIFIFGVISLVAFSLSWAIRTFIDHRRWSRLSRTQTEVHTKILDRLSTSEELLEYVKSPSGSRFLESAPIPLHPEPIAKTLPVPRVIRTMQTGIIIASGAIGALIGCGRLEPDASKALFALGFIGFFIGAGFIISAVVSMILSRRLGLWGGNASPETPAEPRLMP